MYWRYARHALRVLAPLRIYQSSWVLRALMWFVICFSAADAVEAWKWHWGWTYLVLAAAYTLQIYANDWRPLLSSRPEEVTK